jgi:hypothetical protein
MDNKLLIFYLTANDRYFVFTKFIDEILKSNVRNNIRLLLVNSNSDFSFYKSYLNDKGIEYDTAHVECPQSNYLPKVHYAINYAKDNGFLYIMKYDNDILMPAYTLDFIVQNLKELENPEVATISPTITTGIPSVEYFIDDFLSDEEARQVREEFKKCQFFIQPNVMDYRPMNICTIYNEEDWNYVDYFDKLKCYTDSLPDFGNGRTIYNFCKFYMGMHPIRHGFGNQIINDLIIKYKDRFFDSKKCNLFKDDKPYLCDMCFVIKTSNYDILMNQDNLIIDGCDEVPVNRFAWNYNKYHFVIRGGYTIHITYNWRWDLNNVYGGSNIDRPNVTLEEYEETFINSIYDTN